MNDQLSAYDAAFLAGAKIKPEPITGSVEPPEETEQTAFENGRAIVRDLDGGMVAVITQAHHAVAVRRWMEEAQHWHRICIRDGWIVSGLSGLVALFGGLLICCWR